jgi:hypothetical protein
MNQPRTTPNLLEEVDRLPDEAHSYGAYILSRVIGRALQLDGVPSYCGLTNAGPHRHELENSRIAAREYGQIVSQAWPRNPSRRHVTLIDAADLAFA